MSKLVQEAVLDAIQELYPDSGVILTDIVTEIPPDAAAMGDVAVPLFSLARKTRENPTNMAQEVNKKLIQNKSFDKTEAISGYINLWLKSDNLFAPLEKILKNSDQAGRNNSLKGQKIMVEYSSPNTNKPLTVGHARNNFIGMAVSNILTANGAEIIRAQIINNRGVHICKSMYAYLRWGEGRTPEDEGTKPDHFVGEFYVRFSKELEKDPSIENEPQKMLKKWEEGDLKVRALWEKMNSWAEAGWEKTYSRIGSVFDKIYFESDLYDKGREIVKEALNKKIVHKLEDGAIEIDLTDVNLDKKILLRRDGTTVYMTQDLETTRLKFEEYNLGESIWVVGDEQRYHFQVLFELCERFGIAPREKCHHLAYAMVELPEGKMSSRSGVKVDLDTWLDEIDEIARQTVSEKHPELDQKEVEERARQVGTAAAKFQLLRNAINKKVVFDPREAISFEGATGPYLQYAHARIASIFRQAGEVNFSDADLSLLGESTEKALSQQISQYSKSVQTAAQRHDPSVICNYLIDLARAFSSFYAACPVLKANPDLCRARLALCRATQITLCSGLEILGIEAPEQM